jgi:transcriptional regulator with XRE-family HTH domain
MVSDTLGKKIKKEEREQKGLSLRKFASQLDIAPAY